MVLVRCAARFSSSYLSNRLYCALRLSVVLLTVWLRILAVAVQHKGVRNRCVFNYYTLLVRISAYSNVNYHDIKLLLKLWFLAPGAACTACTACTKRSLESTVHTYKYLNLRDASLQQLRGKDGIEAVCIIKKYLTGALI